MFSCSCRWLAALGLVVVWSTLAPARAVAQEPDEGEVGSEPGPQDEPPGPDEDLPPTVNPDADQRKAIRGTSPPDGAKESDAQKAQREWDERAFPRGEAGKAAPGADDSIPGKADLPPELATPQ